MARRQQTSSSQAELFLNVVLVDESGNSFTIGGKALPTTDYPKGGNLPNRVVNKIWRTAETLPSGKFEFPSHGSFMDFLNAIGLRIELQIRRPDDSSSEVADTDDISF